MTKKLFAILPVPYCINQERTIVLYVLGLVGLKCETRNGEMKNEPTK